MYCNLLAKNLGIVIHACPTFTLYAYFVHIIVISCKSKFALSSIFFLIQDMAGGIRYLTKEITINELKLKIEIILASKLMYK